MRKWFKELASILLVMLVAYGLDYFFPLSSILWVWGIGAVVTLFTLMWATRDQAVIDSGVIIAAVGWPFLLWVFFVEPPLERLFRIRHG